MGKIRTAIGLMSGTSMDGIDVALVRTDGDEFVERGPGMFFSYDPDMRRLLSAALKDAKAIVKRDDRPGCLGSAEKEVVRKHVECVQHFLGAQSLVADDVDLLGFHGQTVIHRPDEGYTVQLGDGKQLAKQTGIETVFDMRANDMRHGGQGAPLVPVYHRALAGQLSEFSAEKVPVAFVNIGGISNITYVGAELIAFDCGPGNSLIDQWVQKNVGISHDQGGMIAAEGSIDQAFVDGYMADSFFSEPLPKSLDRSDFKVPTTGNLSVEVVARSLARVTAEGIVRSAELLPEMPGLWVICGGGRQNPHILADISDLCRQRDTKAVVAEEVGFDGDMMEAEAWAYLAVRAKDGLPLTYPGTTGVSKPVSGGQIATSNKIPKER